MTQLSYTHGASDAILLGETIGENLRRTVSQFPGREALVVRSQNFRASYQELWDQTTQCAKALLARGIEKGDRVGVWSPNRYEWVVAQYATARIGAILVNVNPAYKVGELAYTLQQSGLRMLLLARRFRKTDYLEILEAVRPRPASLEQVVVIDDDWAELLASGSDIADETLYDRERGLSFDEPINIQYTSGTTGAPKGATLSHHNVLNNGYFCGEMMRYTEEDRVCVPVPFYHCFGMVVGNLACTTHGAAIVVPGEAFDPLETLQAVEAERCTSLYGVPHVEIKIVEPDDVHRRAPSPGVPALRALLAPHRCHGRLSLSHRSHATG